MTSSQTTRSVTFDLSAFENVAAMNNMAATSKAPDNQINAVLAIPLPSIVEDINQPRIDFNDEGWDNFVADIKKNGVRNPIHIRPAKNGIYTIINGARRFRASIAAELLTIPCIIQEDDQLFNDYAQLLDNIKNKAMTPLEIALFIKKRLDIGDSKRKIAEELSESASFITYHLALIDMPAIVQNAYSAGKIRGAQSIYRINKLFAEDPDLTAQIINDHDEITNSLILRAIKSLEQSNTSNTANEPLNNQNLNVSDSESQTHNQNFDNQTNNTDKSHNEGEGEKSLPNNEITTLPYHHPANEEDVTTTLQDPSKIKKPLLLGSYSNQACVILLHERPKLSGFLWVKLEDTGHKLEVAAESVTLNLLTEAKVKE